MNKQQSLSKSIKQINLHRHGTREGGPIVTATSGGADNIPCSSDAFRPGLRVELQQNAKA